MKKYVMLWCIINLLFLMLFFSCSFFEEENRSAQDTPTSPVITGGPETCQEGEIIVKLPASVPVAEIDDLIDGTRVRTFAAIEHNRYVLYSLNDKQATAATLLTLRASGKVLAAEQNAVYSLHYYEPDDPYYAEYQYAPRLTQCRDAWAVETGSAEVVVAVLDTGINGTHEDLSGRVIAGKNIITGADIPAGVNSDDMGHGTHVAGIIGAMGDNGKGIAGVAWHIRLMPVKLFAYEGSTTTSVIAESLIWAVDHGAKVINMSFGGGVFSMAVNDAVNYALQRKVVLVASMGNDNQYKYSYPAAMPGVMAVGSSNGRDEISFYSSKGNHISVAAPGENIYSLLNTSNTGYTYLSGTSMASPFVAGLAALLLSATADLSPAEVRTMIEESAEPLGADAFSPDYGHGRVNARLALQEVRHNNYGTVTVNVTNRGEAIGGAKVFLQNNAQPAILQSGLTSYGGTAGGVAGQIVFPYVPLGTYTVRIQIGTLQETTVAISDAVREQSLTCAFDTSLVLLVNAVKEDDITVLTDEFLYTKQLNRLGKYFTIWKTAYNGPPSGALLNAYDLVVWFTGRTKDKPEHQIEVLDAQETAVLASYLDQGGRLYLCGNNIAESLSKADPAFLQTYLHARFSDSPFSEDDEFSGRGFLDGMQLLLTIEDDDQIYLESGATGLITALDDQGADQWAGLAWSSNYRLVFTTFCPNQILYSLPETLFEDIIGWLESD